MRDVSVVIVNYNSGPFLLGCFESLHAQRFSGTWEVIVVDNASSDGSLRQALERFPGVRVLAQHENAGFSRAANAGIALSSGRYLFLLNPDTVLSPAVFAEMVTFMDGHRGVGIAGGRVLNPDGSLQLACRRNIPTPGLALAHFTRVGRFLPSGWRIPEYKITRADPEAPAEVGAVSGSYMVIRRAALEQVGLFDETFFMYGEDLDYCARMRQAGWKVCYNPNATVVHYLGVSSAANSERARREFYRAMWVFHQKHYARNLHPLINGAVYLGIAGLHGLTRVRSLIKRKRAPTSV